MPANSNDSEQKETLRDIYKEPSLSVKHRQEDPNQTVLYHYTSQQGLLGILQSRSIWASHFRFLNDSQEFFHAFDRVKSRLHGLIHSHEETQDHHDLKYRVMTGLVDALDTALNRMEKQSTMPGIYAFSLSQQGNLLSQWRAYCPKLGGYSIGFDAQELIDIAARQGFELVRCLYSASDKGKIIDDHIDRELRDLACQNFVLEGGEYVRPNAPQTFDNHLRIIKSRFATAVRKYAPMIKHKAFEEEAEWRLLPHREHRPDPTGFREGSTSIVPYHSISLVGAETTLPIRNIKIGPTPNPSISYEAVKLLLEHLGIEGVNVDKSDVPYRSW